MPAGVRMKGAGSMTGDRTARARLLGLLAAALAVVLSGCAFKQVESLYALPMLPQEFSDLQATIDSTMNELGAEYAVINYGSNTSTIQLLDLDSDGEQETAAVFLRVTAAEEKPLRVCLFRQGQDGVYRRTYMLEGDGNSINSVAYEDLTGDGSREIIVSWQLGAGVHILSAYSLASEGPDELLSAAYNEAYMTVDLDGGGDREILIFLQDNTGEGNNRAEYYDYQDGSMVMTAAAALSDGMRDVVSARAGLLADETPGVYVTLDMEEGMVTDVLALDRGSLVNVTRDIESGISATTGRVYTEVRPADINGDRVLEIPKPAQLKALDPENGQPQYLIYWQQYDRSGEGRTNCITYHATTDGWYLLVPNGWDMGNIAVARDDSLSVRGERAVVFYYWPDGEEGTPVRFLTVYRLTGNNRTARAKLSGRIVLASDSSAIYCAMLDLAALDQTGWDCGLGEEDLAQRFKLITPEWSNQ